MGIDALTRSDAGSDVVPSDAARWLDWVSATATRNHVLDDPLVDWLEAHGEAAGFRRDSDLPGFDVRTDFTQLLFAQGQRFEAAILAHIETLQPVTRIVAGPERVRDLDAARATWAAMCEGAPIIYQGVLRDAEHRTYGAPDLLVRSDVLRSLFPSAITQLEAAQVAPDLDAAWHYRVVDIKFTTLQLTRDGALRRGGGSGAAYRAQLYIYNQALGRLQGFEAPNAYLLGRGWHVQASGGDHRGDSAMERLARVPMYGAAAEALGAEVAAACAWVRALRSEGASWRALPAPSREELYPNMKHTQDAPWHTAKQQIARELEELTLLWQVGLARRRQAHAAGITRWRDPRLTPETAGVTGPAQQPALHALLEVNRTAAGSPVRPTHVEADEAAWRTPPSLEFYVDFETVSDLADDFSAIPRRGGQPLIFIIGCGHLEDGEWRFECFVADAITEEAEARAIDAWLAHMEAVRRRVAPEELDPAVLHWSAAETSSFESAYNSARARHKGRRWPSLAWYDFLQRVVRAEPVVVRGALGFGLKAFAKALHAHGLIETGWGDGPTDGLGAMVGAWWCYEEAARSGVPVGGIDLMQQIVAYNEVDCRVMMEAVRYLRERH